MKYVSIDCEMTGLDAETCQLLELGAIIEDTDNIKQIDEIPKFSCIVEHDHITGQPMGLHMNSRIIGILANMEDLNKTERAEYRKQHKIIPLGLVASSFHMWLAANGIESDNSRVVITVAGKNFAGADKKFLDKVPNWSKHIQIRQRIIDPVVMYTDWKTDQVLPNLNKCLERGGLSGEVDHVAVHDAWDVIRAVRRATNDYTRTLWN